MIEVRGVSKVFGFGDSKFMALNNVSTTIEENEFFTLLGPSGCGKTTLLRLISGFDEPTTGSILLNGQDIGHLPPYQRPVNTVFQNYALFPHMSVTENIAFGLKMSGRGKQEISDTVAEMLELVQMTAMRDRKIGEISGGQQQRVALARALAPRPQVLLLDEPLSALDLKLRKGMQMELKRLQLETGITFVFVTHDQEEAMTMSDRVAVMNAGEILQIGNPRDIYHRPARRFVADFIGEINLINGSVPVTKDSVNIDQTGPLECEVSQAVVAGAVVTAAFRPERLEILSAADEGLAGVIENIVFYGTDNIFHIRLAGGEKIRARVQNNDTSGTVFKVGDPVKWRVAPASVTILEE